jgi:ribosomal protein L14E/L6E/L27E
MQSFVLWVSSLMLLLPLFDFEKDADCHILAGFNRRRVRVKAKVPSQKNSKKPGRAKTAATTSGYSAAPVLTPGAYDADTLLRHRERSASAASAEAIQEWTRTGGHFARVSTVQASKKAGRASSALSPGTASDVLSPPESPRDSYGRVQGVGVEGALLGYFDTDAEDSGLESGQSSPEIGRRGSSGSRRGLSGSALGFTPVSNDASKGLRLEVPNSVSTAIPADADRSPKSNDSVTSSWIRLEESSNEGNSEAAARAAAAADLEPNAV